MNEQARKPAVPRPSATVVVLRDGADAPEILLVRRRAGDAFGESYTYPGGVVDEDESFAHGHVHGRSHQEVDELLGVNASGLDYYSAVIRELFEETGILLARNRAGEWAPDGRSFPEERVEVDAGRMKWPAFLAAHELEMACDALHYFAFWVTPVVLPKRWSTRFFLAALPPGQEAIHDGTELTDARWITAKHALEERRRGNLKMPLPTARTLEQLATHESIRNMEDWADQLARDGIPRHSPVRLEKDGRMIWLEPGDPDYPDNEED